MANGDSTTVVHKLYCFGYVSRTEKLKMKRVFWPSRAESIWSLEKQELNAAVPCPLNN
jgi:hypothetical protein